MLTVDPMTVSAHGVLQLHLQLPAVVLRFFALPLQIVNGHFVQEDALALHNDLGVSGDATSLEGRNDLGLSGAFGAKAVNSLLEVVEGDSLLSVPVLQDLGVLRVDIHRNSDR
eukprot:11657742-Heterocapsa_arctica.AAC.1